jgi:cbb3-type cytochrome oxidase maturation protein
MIDFFFLIPIAIGLGLIGLASFMWTLKNGQYDDLEGRRDADPVRGRGRPAARKTVSGACSGAKADTQASRSA